MCSQCLLELKPKTLSKTTTAATKKKKEEKVNVAVSNSFLFIFNGNVANTMFVIFVQYAMQLNRVFDATR